MSRVTLCVLLLSATSGAAQDSFPIPAIDWAKGIHGHGDMLWVAASNQGLLEIARGGAVTRVPNIRSAIAVGGREDTVYLKQAVPVHLVYRTAFSDARGEVQFRADIYGRDAALFAALRRAGVAIPGLRS